MKAINFFLITFLLAGLLKAQIVNNDINFKDSDDNLILRIVDEGNFSSIQIKSGVPSMTLNKLYNDNGGLSFNGSKLLTNDLPETWKNNDSIVSLVDSTNYVAIGTDNPIGALHVSSNNGVIFTGDYNNGVVQNLGDGIRMHWYPHKGAFRAGDAFNDEWDDINIGGNSAAFGYHTLASGASTFAAGDRTKASGTRSTAFGKSTTASGDYSTALGQNTDASGENSTSLGYYSESSGISSVAMGEETEAIGDHSTTMGFFTTAIGNKSVAMGNNTEASGSESIAMGLNSIASGNQSTALGSNTLASESHATALGSSTEASGLNSIAMGYWTTASGNYSATMGARVEAAGIGTFFFGDNSAPSPQTKSVDNRFYARFGNGYKLYTDAGLTVGAQMLGGANSWSVISDSSKKENFKIVNGERILEQISDFKLPSWNYKGQDPVKFRHYGPMAQDFFDAFGYDGIGTIGNDTTIASADFDGINLIAIQALEKRTRMLEERIKHLETENKKLKFINSSKNDFQSTKY